jgi:metal-responsive CopG/Arc/MetJ family transcriptional regulator
MSNNKPEEKRKSKLSVTINKKLVQKMDKFLSDEEINNRSKYIEKLIREDMEKRGKDVSMDF